MSKARDLADGTFDTDTLVVDAANNRVGVGTSSPGRTLEAYSSQPAIKLNNGTNAFTIGTGAFVDGSDSLIFFDEGVGERARIDSGGNLMVGTANIDPTFNRVNGTVITDSGRIYSRQIGGWDIGLDSTSGTHIYFYTDNGARVVAGSISSSGSSTAFNTSSDYRLKEDIQPMIGASDRVLALNPVNFAWKVDGTRVDGFLAHEVADIVSEAVSGEKDAMREEPYEVTPAVLDDDGNVVTEAVMGTREVIAPQGIDQSKLVPLLTAALQEALSEIADLKTRVAALETP